MAFHQDVGRHPASSDDRRRRDTGGPTPAVDAVASAGPDPPPPEAALARPPLTDHEVLALQGPGLTAEDRDILAAFAAQLATALESDRLHAEAAEADSLARANQLRSALLAAVSHDLRTPLASIKAASSSLLSDQLDFGPDETGILVRTIDDEADRLSSLVENLLDMSRLETGAMEILRSPTDVEELVESALTSLGPRARVSPCGSTRRCRPSRPIPDWSNGSLANLVDNAVQHSAGRPVRVEAGTVAGRVDVRVVDHGPGIRVADRERIFLPFQRLGDTDNGTGVGLGLAVSRGFAEAVGGELDVEDTPGGGCTMVLRLPASVERTSTILDADLDEDVLGGDDGDGADDGDGGDDGDAERSTGAAADGVDVAP